ncbi:putative ribonuclease H-like domain-containing protein [Tanacetum coccineum]
MTGNMSYLTNFEEIDGGYVAFGGNPKGGKIAGSGPNWLFDIDALTNFMNYKPVVVGNQSNGNAGTKACDDAGDDEKNITEELGKEGGDSSKDSECSDQEKEYNVNSTNTVNAASINEVNSIGAKTSIELLNDLNIPELEDIVYSDDDEDMNVNSAFLYGKIEEEVYVYQPLGFEDPDFPNRRGKIDKTLFIRRDKGDILLVQVYVDDIIFGFIKKSLCTEFEKMMHKKFQMSSMGELTFFLGPQVKQKEDGVFINQDNKEVDVHLYRSMIDSLMYLTSSRPDIMYLKDQPKLGLWYLKDLPFDLVAYTDSDYAGVSLDRKSITRGCQFLRSRLISWLCKKQTVVANSTTEAEYIAASSCCRQVLWIQNQLLDYEYNFLHTKIFIDNNSTICIM